MKLFKKLLLIFCLIYCYVVEAQTWKPTTTSINFTTKMLGVKVEGKFKGFQGIINFNPSDLDNSNISGTVDAATLDTDNNLRNNHLKEKPEFFDIVKYPKLKMTSTKIEKNPIGGYIGTFNFTVKSITKSLKLPFTVEMSSDKAVFKGTTKLNRKDWQLGGNTMGMSNEVTINITINSTK